MCACERGRVNYTREGGKMFGKDCTWENAEKWGGCLQKCNERVCVWGGEGGRGEM